MSVSCKRGFAAASILAITASAGWADVTAEEVWTEWKSYMESVGYSVTATENSAGGVVAIKDLVMDMPLPEGQGSGSVSLPQITLSENGDGTVTVALPDSFPITVKGTEGDEEFDVTLDVAQVNAGMVVSGNPGDITSTYGADMFSMALGTIKVDGFTLPPEIANFTIAMSDLNSTTRQSQGELRLYDQVMSAGAVTITGAFDDPESDDEGSLTATMNGLTFEGSAEIPENMNVEDMRAMLDAGFGFSGTFSYGAGETAVSGVGDGESFALQSAVQGGSVEISMNSESLVYNFLYDYLDMTVQSGSIPFPLMVSAAELGMNLGMPLAISEDEQDFAFGLSLRDLAVPEMLWGMVDPSGALPHDPASLVLDVTGKTKMLFDLMDPASAMAMGDQPPGELNSLSLNELLVSAAGAKIVGTGDFTFDNSDLSTYGGMPAPIGKSNFEIVGANGLIDALIGMGLLAETDAMGARMMMGLLATPGDGPDTLVSEIEFGEGGSISANGQRIK